jgi:hypothetical protein
VIIAGLVDIKTKEPVGRVYLGETPFPGDTISVDGDSRTVQVVRRTFLDLGPDYSLSNPVLSVLLEVRAS